MPNKPVVKITTGDGRKVAVDAEKFSKEYERYAYSNKDAKVSMYDTNGKEKSVPITDAYKSYQSGYTYWSGQKNTHSDSAYSKAKKAEEEKKSSVAQKSTAESAKDKGKSAWGKAIGAMNASPTNANAAEDKKKVAEQRKKVESKNSTVAPVAKNDANPNTASSGVQAPVDGGVQPSTADVNTPIDKDKAEEMLAQTRALVGGTNASLQSTIDNVKKPLQNPINPNPHGNVLGFETKHEAKVDDKGNVKYETKIVEKGKEAQKREFTDRLAKSRSEDSFRSDANSLVNSVADELAEKAMSQMRSGAGSVGGALQYGLDPYTASMKIAKEANYTLSPENIQAHLDSMNMDDIISKAVMNADGTDYNMNIKMAAKNSGISESEYVSRFILPRLGENIGRALNERMGRDYKVQNYGDYITRSMQNSWLGTLGMMIGTTKGQRQQLQQAYGDYEKNLGFWGKAGGMAAGVVGDLPLFFVGGGAANVTLKGLGKVAGTKAGQAVVNTAGKVASKVGLTKVGNAVAKVAPKMGKLFSPTIEKVAGSQVAARYEQFLLANMSKSGWWTRELLRGIPSSMANMGTFMGIKGATTQLSVGDDSSALCIVKALGEGVLDGSIMGLGLGLTAPAGKMLSGLSKTTAGRIAGTFAGKTIELGTFVGIDGLKGNWNDLDSFTDNLIDNAAMIVGMGLGTHPVKAIGDVYRTTRGLVKYNAGKKIVIGKDGTPRLEDDYRWNPLKAWKQMFEKHDNPYKFTQAEKDNFNDKYGNTPLFTLLDMNNVDFDKVNKAIESGDQRVIADTEREFVQLISDRQNIPWETRNKISINLFGVGETARPYFGRFNTIEGNRVELRASNGDLIAVKDYKNIDELTDIINTEKLRTEQGKTADLCFKFDKMDIDDATQAKIDTAYIGIENAYGYSKKDIYKILSKDYHNITDKEREALSMLNTELRKISDEFNAGKPAVEASTEQGHNDADVHDVTQQPDPNYVQGLYDDMVAKKAKVEAYGDNITTEAEEVDILLKNGTINQKQADAMLQQVRDYNDYMNAEARYNAFKEKTAENIRQAAEIEWQSTSNGDLGRISARDANGEYFVISDINSSDGVVTEGKTLTSDSGMAIVVDKATGEIKYIKPEELVCTGVEAKDEFMNARVAELQEKISNESFVAESNAVDAPLNGAVDNNGNGGADGMQKPKSAPETGGKKEPIVDTDINKRRENVLRILDETGASEEVADVDAMSHEDVSKLKDNGFITEDQATELDGFVALRDGEVQQRVAENSVEGENSQSESVGTQGEGAVGASGEKAGGKIPVDEKTGKKVYENADVADTYDDVVASAGGNEDMANKVISKKVSNAEKALETAKKKQEKGAKESDDIEAMLAEENALTKAVEDAQKTLDYWKKVAGEKKRRADEAMIDEAKGNVNALGEEINPNRPHNKAILNRVKMAVSILNGRDVSELNDKEACELLSYVQMFKTGMERGFEYTEKEQAFFNEISAKAEELGYEVVDMRGQKYTDNMPFEARFINDEELEEGERVISGFDVPMIRKNGNMIQAPKLVVRQGIKIEPNTAETVEEPKTDSSEMIPDITNDTPQAARERGKVSVNGVVYERQNKLEGIVGKVCAVIFGKGAGDKKSGHMKLAELDNIQESHKGQSRNPMHFIPEAQPKDRTSEDSRVAAMQNANPENFDPARTTGDGNAYLDGSPIVNMHGEVIQGNGRVMMLREVYKNAESARKYKEYLKANAEKFGLKPEDIDKMDKPVLVNELAVNDKEAIRLGQMTATDLESGGEERIKSKNFVQKAGEKFNNFINLLFRSDSEDSSIAQLIDENGIEVLKWANRTGLISDTQMATAVRNGKLTAEAKNDITNILKERLFDGAPTTLREQFENMPNKAQKAILATYLRDINTAKESQILGDIRQSIQAFDELMKNKDFENATKYADVKKAINNWLAETNAFEDIQNKDKFSNFALELAARMKSSKQKEMTDIFNQYYDLVQGKKATDLFADPAESSEPLSKAEAIKKLFNIEENGVQRSNDVAGDGGASREGKSGGTGDAESGERTESGGESADSGEGNRGDGSEGKKDVEKTPEQIENEGYESIKKEFEDKKLIPNSEESWASYNSEINRLLKEAKRDNDTETENYVKGQARALNEFYEEWKKEQQKSEEERKAKAEEDTKTKIEADADYQILSKDTGSLSDEDKVRVKEIIDADESLDDEKKGTLKSFIDGDNVGPIEQLLYKRFINKQLEDVRNRYQSDSSDSEPANGTQLGEGVDDTSNVRGDGRDGRESDSMDREPIRERDGNEDSSSHVRPTSGESGNNENAGTETKSNERTSGRSNTVRGSKSGNDGRNVRGGKRQEGSDSDTGKTPERGTGSAEAIASAEQRLKDKFAKFKDAFNKPVKRDNLKSSLIPTPSWFEKFFREETTDAAMEVLDAARELGYEYLKAGYRDIQSWIGKIKDQFKGFLADLEFTDAEADEFINSLWDSAYTINGDTKKMKDWAIELGREETRKQAKITLAEKRKLQKKADSKEVKTGDIVNIRETLPYLLPKQHEDVLKAEIQFFDESHNKPELGNGRGYLFTNGTGTGKTYTGLGIIKRFIKTGKERVLILTPSQQKVSDWIKDGKNLDIQVNAILDTKDKGSGVVITTFANFRENDALMEDQFDLVVYDESHRILENKTGAATTGEQRHYAITNRDEYSSLDRLKWASPFFRELEEARAEHKKINDEITVVREAYQNNQDPSKNQLYVSKLMELNMKLNEITLKKGNLEAREQEEEEKLKPIAKESVGKTKAVFLSATPFNTPANLVYAADYIFGYGNKADATREERASAGAKFFNEKFGSSLQASTKDGRLVLKPKEDNPEAAENEARDFSDTLQKNGTMSGRIIDSEFDYSRDFPTVSLDKADTLNHAIQVLTTGSGVPKPIREAAKKTFNEYNYMTALFEAMKAPLVVPRVLEHLERGRKVVIFHRRIESKEALERPFERIIRIAREDDALTESLNKDIEWFRNNFADLLEWEKSIDISLPRDQIVKALGEDKVLLFSGRETKKQKAKAIEMFNDDNSGKDVIIIQEDSGKEGISLHDITGKHQRVCMNLGLPVSPITALQIEGRIYRIGNASNAIFEYPILGVNKEIELFSQQFNKRVGMTELLSLGSQARSLRESYQRGVYEHSGVIDVDSQGVGGKSYDGQAQAEQNFRTAVEDYLRRTLKESKYEQGDDDFVTPEPLGFKMQEWGIIGEGESILEPSAGEGNIARYVPRSAHMTALEPTDRRVDLGLIAGGAGREMRSDKFEDYNIVNKHDVILMNPPIGEGNKTSIEHVNKAIKHLNEGGRLITVIPDKAISTITNNADFAKKNGMIITGTVKLPSFIVSRGGKDVECSVVVMDKVSNEKTRQKMRERKDVDLSDAKDIQDFFTKLEGVSMPDRKIDKKAIDVKKITKTLNGLKRKLKSAEVKIQEENGDIKFSLTAILGKNRNPSYICGMKLGDRSAYLDLLKKARRYRDRISVYSEKDQQYIRAIVEISDTLSEIHGVKDEEAVINDRWWPLGELSQEEINLRDDVYSCSKDDLYNFTRVKRREINSMYYKGLLNYEQQDRMTDIVNLAAEDVESGKAIITKRRVDWDKLGELSSEEESAVNRMRGMTILQLQNEIYSSEGRNKDIAKMVMNEKINEQREFLDKFGVERKQAFTIDKLDKIVEEQKLDDVNKDLYNRLSAVVSNIGTKIVFTDSMSNDILGTFNHGTNMLELNINMLGGKDKYGKELGEVIVHELIHSVSSYALHQFERGNLSKDSVLYKAAKQLNDVYREVSDMDEIAGQYGTTNVYEMVAEMANPRFRESMKKINLWTKMVNAVKRIIGFEVSDATKTTAYKETMDALDMMLNNFNAEEFFKAKSGVNYMRKNAGAKLTVDKAMSLSQKDHAILSDAIFDHNKKELKIRNNSYTEKKIAFLYGDSVYLYSTKNGIQSHLFDRYPIKSVYLNDLIDALREIRNYGTDESSKRLLDYLESARRDGLSDSDILSALRESGFTESSNALDREHNGDNREISNGERFGGENIRDKEAGINTFEKDEEYVKAVNEGDGITVDRILQETISDAMPNTKVVDKNGDLLLVHHGTNSKFYVFDINKAFEQTKQFINGAFFTPSTNVAKAFADARVKVHGGEERIVNAYLNIEKPYEISAEDFIKCSLDEEYKNKVLSEIKDGNYDGIVVEYDKRVDKKMLEIGAKLRAKFPDINDAQNYLKEKGYSSDERWDIMAGWMNPDFTEKQYAVFKSEQIKSADIEYNDKGELILPSERGKINNPDIRYSEGDSATSRGTQDSVEKRAEVARGAIDSLGGKGRVHTSVDTITDSRVRRDLNLGRDIKGWYDTKTGEVHIFVPKCTDTKDVERTVMHEKVGHEGLRGLLGEKFNGFLHKVFRGLGEDARKAIIKNASAKGWNFDEALDEYLAKAAEDFSDTGRSVIKRVKDVLNDVLRGLGWKKTCTEDDVRTALWLSKNKLENKTGSVEYRIRKAAFESKLKRYPAEEKMSEDGQKFVDTSKGKVDGNLYASGVSTPSNMSARDRYHDFLSGKFYNTREAHQDYMLSARGFIEAILNGKKMKDGWDFYNRENQLSSKNMTEQQRFEFEKVNPFSDVVKVVLPLMSGKSVEERYESMEKYTAARHGLERNRVFAVEKDVPTLIEKANKELATLNEKLRLAEEAYNNSPTNARQKKVDDARIEVQKKEAEIQNITDMRDSFYTERDRLYTELENGRINLREYLEGLDAHIRKAIPDYDAGKNDKSGLSSTLMYGDGEEYSDTDAIDDVMSIETTLGKKNVDNYWKTLTDITGFALDKEYNSQLADRDIYRKNKNMFKWYVPLRGFSEDTAEDMYSYINGGVTFTGKPIVHANGRKSLANHPIATALAMANQSIMRGNRNLMKTAFYRFVTENPSDLVTEMTTVWYEQDPNTGDWSAKYPTINENMTADEVADAIETFNQNMETAKANGALVKKQTDFRGDVPYRIVSPKDKNQHIVEVSIGGKRHSFIINGHPRVAQAINGLVKDKSGIAAFDWMKNKMSQLATTYSLTFMARNAVRDWEFASAYLLATEGGKYAAKFEKNYAALGFNVAGAKRSKAKDFEGMLMLFHKYNNGKIDANSSQVEKYFKEFCDNGAITGFVQLKDVDKYQDEINNFCKKISKPTWIKNTQTAGHVATLGLIKVAEGYGKTVSTINEAIENHARFAAYMTSREMGRTIVRSVTDAKNVSVNFNKKGSGSAIKDFKLGEDNKLLGINLSALNRNFAGTTAHYMRNYIMFYNAGVQGMNNFGHMGKMSPKTTLGLCAIPFTTGLMLSALNAIVAQNDNDDDRRKFGDDPYSQLPEYERRQNMCFYLGHGNWLKIPLAIELRAFHGLGDIVAGRTYNPRLHTSSVTDPENGLSTFKELTADVMSQFTQITPVDFMGSKSLTSDWKGSIAGLVMPSFAAPVAGVLSNVKWTGAPIWNDSDWKKNDAEWEKAFGGTSPYLVNLTKEWNNKTRTGKNSIGEVNLNPAALEYLLQSYLGGPGKDILEFANALNNGFDAGNFPISKAFYRSRTPDNTHVNTRTRYYAYNKEAEQTDSDYKKFKEEAEGGDLTSKTKYKAMESDHGEPIFSLPYRRMKVTKKYEKKIKTLQNKKNEADNSADKNAYQEQINVLMQDMVDIMDEMENNRKEGKTGKELFNTKKRK